MRKQYFLKPLLASLIVVLVPQAACANWQQARYVGGSVGVIAGATLLACGISELAAMNYCKPIIVGQMLKEPCKGEEIDKLYQNLIRGYLCSTAMLIIGSAMLYGNCFYVLPK